MHHVEESHFASSAEPHKTIKRKAARVCTALLLVNAVHANYQVLEQSHPTKRKPNPTQLTHQLSLRWDTATEVFKKKK